MKITSNSFDHGGTIPDTFAFARPGGTEPTVWSDNHNPHLAWSELPDATRSLVLICVDSDVPTVFDHVNRHGHRLPADMPRQEFIHWVVVDIPPSVREIAAGSCAQGVVKGGKQNPTGPAGSRQGSNDYGGFMGDGDYLGYDGPCPPWNDDLLHRFHFRLFALDLEHLPLAASFGAADVHQAMRGHLLGETALHGTYTLNAQLRGTG